MGYFNGFQLSVSKGNKVNVKGVESWDFYVFGPTKKMFKGWNRGISMFLVQSCIKIKTSHLVHLVHEMLL